jgi:multidrug efflux pump subunit AcrB
MRRALQHPDDGRIPGDRRVGATYLGAGQGGLPIRLADVASVRRRLADAEVRVRAQGASAVGIAVEMLPDRNAIELGQRVRRLLDTRDLPAGMHSVMVADEPTYVAERLSLLALSLHRRSGGGGRLMKWIEPLYRPLLDSAVRRPRRVLGGFVGLIALTLAMMAAWLWPPVFFPDADRHQFLVKVQLPTGHLSLLQRVRRRSRREPGTDHREHEVERALLSHARGGEPRRRGPRFPRARGVDPHTHSGTPPRRRLSSVRAGSMPGSNARALSKWPMAALRSPCS